MHYNYVDREKVEVVMSLHKNHEYDDGQSFSDFQYEENRDELNHKKRIKQMLEDRLERKRLKEELEDEFDGEFDWDDLDK